MLPSCIVPAASALPQVVSGRRGHYCREPLPGIWDQYLDQFQKLLVLRCLRGDKVTNAMQDFVATNLEPRFIEPQASAASQCPE